MFEELATRAHDMELSIANRGAKDFLVLKMRSAKNEIDDTKKILLPELVAGSLSVKLSEMTPNGRSTMVTKDGVRSWPEALVKTIVFINDEDDPWSPMFKSNGWLSTIMTIDCQGSWYWSLTINDWSSTIDSRWSRRSEGDDQDDLEMMVKTIGRHDRQSIMIGYHG
ncbi:ty3-gypsy retrotransposon protein [Cucumis melo var. makuwa]|uniref:Ty3-gypsy retrotransposon protein n=1 Tax=Cucumis melo var. makuwa TaxID=1194695 RepID=A0A5D3DH02_CUCMM|nr:ty3-gypsy retrotransposon protein [Cucumis melo var. makuwa]TYK22894.1 ty3-gypsy retrotransposon protein [Cucumis melo var. makuwa]